MSEQAEQVAVAVRPTEQPLALRKTPRSAAGSNMYRVVSVASQANKKAPSDTMEQSARQETPASSAADEMPKKTTETTKRKRSSSNAPSKKKQRGNGEGGKTDDYCWVCHKECNMLTCEVCPRTYHLKCVTLEEAPGQQWVCPECAQIMRAENMDMRSCAMQTLTIDQLCNLLKFALVRMKHQCAEEFLRPVSLEAFPKYSEFICHPMDLETLEKNIKKKQYGCTESFLADMKWIVHNCIIFNGYHNRLTSLSKSLLKICKHEMSEIEVCPDCYHNAYSKKENWFIEPCCPPHLLIWAKLKGFPFWPAKAMRVVNGNVDVRFFGAHDRSWIPLANCYLLSKEAPTCVKMKKKGMFEQSMHELDSHIEKLTDMFHNFGYAQPRQSLNASNLKSDVQDMLPGVNLKDYRRSSIGRIGLNSKGAKSSTPPSSTNAVSSQPKIGDVSRDTRLNLVQIKVERFDYPSSASPHASDDSGHASEGSRVAPPSSRQHHHQTAGPKSSKRPQQPTAESGSKLEATIAKLQAKSNNVLEGRESRTGSSSESTGEMVAEAGESASVEQMDEAGSSGEVEEIEDLEAMVTEREGVDAIATPVSEPCEVSSTTCVTDELSVKAACSSSSPSPKESLASPVVPASPGHIVPSGDDCVTVNTAVHGMDTDDESPLQPGSPVNVESDRAAPEKATYSDITDPETSTDSSSNALTIDDRSAQTQTPITVRKVTLATEIVQVADCVKTTEKETEVSLNDDKSERESEVVPRSTQSELMAELLKPTAVRAESLQNRSPKSLTSAGSASGDVGRMATGELSRDADDRRQVNRAREAAASMDSEDSAPPAASSPEAEETGSDGGRLVLDKVMPESEERHVVNESYCDEVGATVAVDSGLGRTKDMTASLVSTLIGELTKLSGSGDADGVTSAQRLSPMDVSMEADESGSQGDVGDLIIDLDRDYESGDGRSAGPSRKVAKKTGATKGSFGGIRLKEKKVVREKDKAIVAHKSKTAHAANLDTLTPQVCAAPSTSLVTLPEVAPLPMLAPMGMQGPRFHLRLQQEMPRTMPALQLRPVIVDPTSIAASSTSTTPVSQQDSVCKYSKKMAEFVRGTMEEMFRDLAKTGNPEATIKTLQLEMEKMQWRHQQEMAEMKHNTDLILLETRNSMEADKQRAINEIRRQCELDKQKAVEDAKRKLWCATCGKEAIFYCCWNTAYCDYPCQQAHWPSHVNSCTQGHNAKKSRTSASDIALEYEEHNRRKSAPVVVKKATGGQSRTTSALHNSMLQFMSSPTHQQPGPRPSVNMSNTTQGFRFAPPVFTVQHAPHQHGMPGTSSLAPSHIGSVQQRPPVQGVSAMYPVTNHQHHHHHHQHKPISQQYASPNVQLYLSHHVRSPHSLTVTRGHSAHQFRGRTFL